MKGIFTAFAAIVFSMVIATPVFSEGKVTEAVEYGGIKLVFNDGRVGVYYKGLALTENGGLDAEFYEGNELYRNADASWKVKKQGNNAFVAVATWPAPGIKQSWAFTIGKNCVDVDIELISEHDIELKDAQIGVNLKKGYGKWVHYSGGAGLNNAGGKEGLAQEKLFALAVVNGFEARAVSFPALSFDIRGSSGGDQSLLKKITFHPHQRYSLLLYSPLFEPLAIRKGTHCLFSGRISFFSSDAEMDSFVKKVRQSREISLGPLKVFFNEGSSRIFCEKRELTSHSNVYQEISVPGASYLSDSATWEVKKKSPHKLEAVGRWWNIPIVQTVEIEVEDNNTIVYNIRTKLLHKTHLEGEAFILMLSRDFDAYLVPHSAKRALFCSLSDGEKDPGVVWEGEVRVASSIRVFNNLQGVSLALDCSLAPPECMGIISHTAGDNKARILMCRRVNKSLPLEPGEYSFPTMKIKVVKRRGL